MNKGIIPISKKVHVFLRHPVAVEELRHVSILRRKFKIKHVTLNSLRKSGAEGPELKVLFDKLDMYIYIVM